ncbi:hypothetical protein [Yersinia ruckeri]|uniref:hypothetical protein n=1 Tax=Yersinia ruckeri TaxID=29486 RepID=UPI002239044C|nr:hypothetical protein [Yersinia ruckeri]MCW6598740.1 hypothetical protein [Yersinia ruckeri]
MTPIAAEPENTWFYRQIFDLASVQAAVARGTNGLPSRYPLGTPVVLVLEVEEGPVGSFAGILVGIMFYVDKIYYTVAVPIEGSKFFSTVNVPSDAVCSVEEFMS